MKGFQKAFQWVQKALEKTVLEAILLLCSRWSTVELHLGAEERAHDARGGAAECLAHAVTGGGATLP